MKFELRDYQIKALNVIDRDLQTMPEVLLQGITGCGKTTIFSRLINKYYKETDRRFLVLVHKQEVVQQIYDTLRDRTDISFQDLGICCASLNQKVIDRRVTVASIQTFVNVIEQYSYADLIIVDEAHKIEISSDTQYRKAFNHLRLQRPNCRIFGCTSTAARLGHGYIFGDRCKKGSVNLFPVLNHRITYEELRQKGYLVELRGVIAAGKTMERDLAGISVNGDYVISELGELLTQERHMHTAVEAIEKYCQNYQKICVFCCTIDHAEQLSELIGDTATVVHSQLNSIDRTNNMEAWRSGRKRIVCSIGILTEGVDIPSLDCLVFARPTLSSTLYLQAVGRVLRTHPDKDHGFLVDLTTNSSNFGLDLDNVKVTVPRSVEAAEAKEREIWKICPNCESEIHVARRECDCGFTWPEAECVIAKALPPMEEVIFIKSPPEWFKVLDFGINIHTSKKNDKELGKARFAYEDHPYFGLRYVYMWLCFEDNYSGFAVDRAAEKWTQISSDDFPTSVEEFMDADFDPEIKIEKLLESDFSDIIPF